MVFRIAVAEPFIAPPPALPTALRIEHKFSGRQEAEPHEVSHPHGSRCLSRVGVATAILRELTASLCAAHQDRK
jgi:hypothetical protein